MNDKQTHFVVINSIRILKQYIRWKKIKETGRI